MTRYVLTTFPLLIGLSRFIQFIAILLSSAGLSPWNNTVGSSHTSRLSAPGPLAPLPLIGARIWGDYGNNATAHACTEPAR